MDKLILILVILICVGLYAIERTLLEILRTLRLINVKNLNAALFVREQPSVTPEPRAVRDDKVN